MEVFATSCRTGEPGVVGDAARCAPDPEAQAPGPVPRSAETLPHEMPRAPTSRFRPCSCCSRAAAGRSRNVGQKAFVGEQQWSGARVVHRERMFGHDAHELRRRPTPHPAAGTLAVRRRAHARRATEKVRRHHHYRRCSVVHRPHSPLVYLPTTVGVYGRRKRETWSSGLSIGTLSCFAIRVSIDWPARSAIQHWAFHNHLDVVSVKG
jgi:hypothetical protein